MKDTGPAKLPGLARISTGIPALDGWIQDVNERMEVREGARGNPYERVVTVRELTALGLDSTQWGRMTGTAISGVMVQSQDGKFTRVPLDAFADEIRKTRLYRDLQLAIDDVTRFDGVPDQVKSILLDSIADEAAKRGADIQRLDKKIQSTTESLAYTVQEITAAVQGAAAGVREVSYASASANASTSGKVTQVVARIDNVTINPADILPTVYASLVALWVVVPVGVPGKFYQVTGSPILLYRWTGSAYVLGGSGTTATVEQRMTATADRVQGALASYTIRLGAGGAATGFALAASEDPTGATTSTFIVQADTFSVVMPGFSGAVPFGVDATGAFINGTLRVNSGGSNVNTIVSNTATALSTANSAASNTATALSTANSAASDAATALSGLSTKLSNNARNVLSGYGGIAVGNLVWNSSGVRISGYGVGFSANGLAAYNSSGVATFTLDATTGDATFGGTVAASQISAGTLTGFTIQTAATGRRVVVDATSLRSYDSSGNKIVEIGASGAVAGIHVDSTAAGNATGAAAFANSGGWVTLIANATGSGQAIYATSSTGMGGEFRSTTAGITTYVATASYGIDTNGVIRSSRATGTSPFAITSTTVNTNLNADLLDGNHASAFAAAAHAHTDYASVNLANLPSGASFYALGGGGSTVTFTNNTKPGTATTTNTWLQLSINGVLYALPAWICN